MKLLKISILIFFLAPIAVVVVFGLAIPTWAGAAYLLIGFSSVLILGCLTPSNESGGDDLQGFSDD